MPWNTPTLGDLRRQNRDNIAANLPGADATIPNSVLRVLSDGNAGLAYLTMLYLDWLSKQLLPDTAEEDWLLRHARIWLKAGPKAATFSTGTATFTGIAGSVVPAGFQLSASSETGTILFETTEPVTIGSGPTATKIRALTPGLVGNLAPGVAMSLTSAIPGVEGVAIAVIMSGGTEAETMDQLRGRVLDRVQKPPMGGDADDYVAWALEVPGVTRAWCAPNEMGPGTVTVRIMCDDLRASTNPLLDGFPLADDLAAAQAHLDAKRPVAVKDFFVVGPSPEPINFTIAALSDDDESTWAAIAVSVAAMLKERAAPAHAINGVRQDAQTIYEAWVSEAAMQASGVDHFDLDMADHVMPTNGSLAVLGTITRG